MFYLTSLAITNIIAGSLIFEPIRNLFKKNEYLYHGIHCYLCVGFWTGLILSFIYNTKHIESALISSLICYIFNTLITFFEKER